jgi:hypothetical protein
MFGFGGESSLGRYVSRRGREGTDVPSGEWYERLSSSELDRFRFPGLCGDLSWSDREGETE